VNNGSYNSVLCFLDVDFRVSVLVLLSLFASMRTCSSANSRKTKRAAIWIAMGYTSIGAILATGAAAMMTGGAQESFLDCRNAQQQSYGYTG
jgi:hypothetical protein